MCSICLCTHHWRYHWIVFIQSNNMDELKTFDARTLIEFDKIVITWKENERQKQVILTYFSLFHSTPPPSSSLPSFTYKIERSPIQIVYAPVAMCHVPWTMYARVCLVQWKFLWLKNTLECSHCSNMLRLLYKRIPLRRTLIEQNDSVEVENGGDGENGVRYRQ